MMKKSYGNQIRLARVQRRPSRLRSIRQGCAKPLVRASFHFGAPREGISQEGRCEPKQARPKAESYRLGSRFPRPCRLVSGYPPAPDQFGIREALADNLTHDHIESVCIVHIDPIIETERLFIQVAEQMVRFYRNVSTVYPALQQTPEILHAVRMYIAIHVGDGVINDLVNKFAGQAFIGLQCIAVQRRSRLNVFAHQRLQIFFLAAINDLGANLAAALHHSSNDGLTFRPASSLNLACFDVRVHVTGLAAYKRFVNLDFAREFSTILALMCKANAMQHEPRGFLSDPKSAANFITGDSVLGIRDEPHARKPLVESQRGILKDRANLDGELPLGMMGAALPAKLILEEANLVAPAGRARHNAIGPAAFRDVGEAVVGNREIKDCFLKGLGSVGFHELILPRTLGLVKYIYTHIKEGGILLSVHCDTSAKIARAKDVLKHTGAQHISSTAEASAEHPADSKVALHQ